MPKLRACDTWRFILIQLNSCLTNSMHHDSVCAEVDARGGGVGGGGIKEAVALPPQPKSIGFFSTKRFD